MTFLLDRRSVMTAGVAALALPAAAAASQTGTRSFRVTRDGSDIGTHRVSVTREGDAVRARTDIDIAVRILGITAYRYELAYTEVYRNGLLQAFDATSNDDGDRGYVKAIRSGDVLEIDGSGYSGAASGGSVPTSYWRKPGLSTTPWISAQDGALLPVNISQIAPVPQAPSGSQVWRASDNDKYLVNIWYDAAGDWTGCSFDAGGELGVYTLESGSDSLVGMTT